MENVTSSRLADLNFDIKLHSIQDTLKTSSEYLVELRKRIEDFKEFNNKAKAFLDSKAKHA